ncbi:MAG: bacterioferritin, partial [Stenotrophomonas sp.]
MSKQPAAKSAKTTQLAGITDRKTLRANARKSIEDGAVTPTYTANRTAVIKLLNDALATEWV